MEAMGSLGSPLFSFLGAADSSPGLQLRHCGARGISIWQRLYENFSCGAQLLVPSNGWHQITCFGGVFHCHRCVREFVLGSFRIQFADVDSFKMRGVLVVRKVESETRNTLNVRPWLLL
jgi:hypothetical protein